MHGQQQEAQHEAHGHQLLQLNQVRLLVMARLLLLEPRSPDLTGFQSNILIGDAAYQRRCTPSGLTDWEGTPKKKENKMLILYIIAQPLYHQLTE